MSYLILVIIMISISIGSLGGGLLVSMIYLWRRYRAVDSLIDLEDLIGMSAIVDLPFDAEGKGKIQVKLDNTVLYLSAFNIEKKQLRIGQKVMILQIEDNKIWVIKDDLL